MLVQTNVSGSSCSGYLKLPIFEALVWKLRKISRYFSVISSISRSSFVIEANICQICKNEAKQSFYQTKAITMQISLNNFRRYFHNKRRNLIQKTKLSNPSSILPFFMEIFSWSKPTFVETHKQISHGIKQMRFLSFNMSIQKKVNEAY